MEAQSAVEGVVGRALSGSGEVFGTSRISLSAESADVQGEKDNWGGCRAGGYALLHVW
jgi:hypothetical protein